MKSLTMICVATVGVLLSGVLPGVAAEAAPGDAPLLDFFKGIYEETPPDCPERMYVNKTASSRSVRCRRILAGEFKADDAEIGQAREELREIRTQILLGRNWPLKEREEFAVPFAENPPVSESDWAKGLCLKDEFALSSMTATGSGIEWRLLWNRDALFVAAKVPDAEITAYRCNNPRNKNPWDADCVEIFVMPDPRLKQYWEIVVNPDGYVFAGLHCNDSRDWFVYCLSTGMAGLKASAKRIPGGYVVQAQIPFGELPNYILGNRPEAGQSLYLALVRVDDGQRRSARPLLYDGHNVFGYFKATLEAAESPTGKRKGGGEKKLTGECASPSEK